MKSDTIKILVIGFSLSLLLWVMTQKPSDTPDIVPAPDPTPIAGRIVVLIVEETADRPKLTAEQADIWFSADVRDYLDSHCEGGKDGWRLFDADQDISGESELWKDAMRRKRDGDFWLMISNGKTGTEGYWPKDKQEALKILKRWGGE